MKLKSNYSDRVCRKFLKKALRKKKFVNIKEIEDIVLSFKNPIYSFLFALQVPEANIQLHEQVVLNSKNDGLCCEFAEHVPGANIEEHFKLILNSGNKYSFDEFIRKVNYKGTKVEQWLYYV